MSNYNPTFTPQDGDRIVATRSRPWPHVVEVVDNVDKDDTTIVVEVDGRCNLPENDMFWVGINGAPQKVHADVIGDILSLADAFSFKRPSDESADAQIE